MAVTTRTDGAAPATGIRLTGRGTAFLVATIALFVAAYGLASRELLLAASVVLVLLVASLVLVIVGRPRLVAVRTFSPAIVAAGGSTTVTIVVRNRSPRRSNAGQWRDSVPWSRSSGGTGGAGGTGWTGGFGELPALAPAGIRFAERGNSATVRYALRAPRRGIFTIGPLLVTVDDPFALVRASSTIAGTDRLVVTPELVDLHDSGAAAAAGEGSARQVQRAAAGNDDDLMTREYRQGDAMRRVHWRASARYGELMVRQEEQRSRPEARLLIDTRATGYADVVDVPVRRAQLEAQSETFEWVVRMVASIGVHLHRTGYIVHVIETAGSHIAALSTRRGLSAHDDAFLASLATITLVEGTAGGFPSGSELATNGSLFAVIAEPDAATIDFIVRQRKPHELAVAFVPVWSSKAREALIAAGWRCVIFRPTDDLADVWASVGSLARRA
jgi:uncharacterized protein (DUF58 family)